MQTHTKFGITKPKIFTMYDSIPQEPHSWKDDITYLVWKESMQTTFDALFINKTQELAPNLGDHKVIGCRWLHKTKTLAIGAIDKQKSRLMLHPYGLFLHFTFILGGNLDNQTLRMLS